MKASQRCYIWRFSLGLCEAPMADFYTPGCKASVGGFPIGYFPMGPSQSSYKGFSMQLCETPVGGFATLLWLAS